MLRLFLLLGLLIGLLPTGIRAEDPKVFTIGVALPMSGDFAKFGLDVQRGMLLAQEDLAAAQTNVRLVYEDTEYISRVAATAARKLIETDKVHVLVSLWDTAEAVAPIAERAKVPHFSIRWNPRVAEDFPHTFTFESTYISWAGAVVRFLVGKHAKRIAVMTDSSAAAWVMARESFVRQAVKAGLSIVNDVQFNGSQDLKTSISKLLSNPGDYIVMLHYEPTLSDVMQQLERFPISTPITGFFEGMEERTNFEGRSFVSQFDTEPWFLEKFARRFPHEKPVKAAFGYDLVTILGKLVQSKAGVPTSAEVLGYLNVLTSYSGATGTISTSGTRNIETTCVVKAIAGGKAKKIGAS